MTMRAACIACAALLLAALAALRPAAAHPHVFIENNFEILYDQRGLFGVEIVWRWDEIYSAPWIEAHDANRNGRFEAEEVKAFLAQEVADPQNFRLFVFLRQGPVRHEFDRVSNMSVAIDGKQVVYRFRVLFKAPLDTDAAMRGFTLGAYDPEWYIDVSFRAGQPPATLSGAPPGCKAVETTDDDNRIFSGLISPPIVKVTCATS